MQAWLLLLSVLEGQWRTDFYATKFHQVQMTHDIHGDQAVFSVLMKNAVPFQTRGLRIDRIGRISALTPVPNAAGTYQTDIAIDKITITMLDPDSVWLANRDGSDFCELRDWQVGVPREVTGRACESNRMASAGDVEKVMFKIDGQRLIWGPYFGDGAITPDASSLAVRSTTLDIDHPYVRVKSDLLDGLPGLEASPGTR